MPEFTYEVPAGGEARNLSDAKIKTALAKLKEPTLDHSNFSASAGITASQLASAAKPVTWYTPKVIATEESRTNTAYGTLTTADEITGVVLPENGLIVIGFAALVKSSVSGAGRIALFIGGNQLKTVGTTAPEVQEVTTSEAVFSTVLSTGVGLQQTIKGNSFVTTGQSIGSGTNSGGFCPVFAAAGTYAISVQYKATSGSVTAKERKLWVAVLGF